MTKRELIEALAPLADDTEILIPCSGTPQRRFTYHDDRQRPYHVNEIRLYGYEEPRPGRWQPPELVKPKFLGVDPLPEKVDDGGGAFLKALAVCAILERL